MRDGTKRLLWNAGEVVQSWSQKIGCINKTTVPRAPDAKPSGSSVLCEVKFRGAQIGCTDFTQRT